MSEPGSAMLPAMPTTRLALTAGDRRPLAVVIAHGGRRGGAVRSARLLLLLAAAPAWLACGPGPRAPTRLDSAAPAAPSSELLPAALVAERVRSFSSDNWYGFYLQDKKVGHAHIVLRPTVAGEPGGYHVGMDVVIRSSSPGEEVEVAQTLAQYYEGAPPYRLLERRARETSADGTSDQITVASADRVVVRASVDGEPATERAYPPTAETVLATLAALALEPAALRPGQRDVLLTFDGDAGRDQSLTVEVLEVRDEVLAGVKTRVATLSQLDEGDTQAATIKVASGGVTLLASLGPGAVLRLEETQVAQSGVEGFSMLGDAVPVDRPLGDPTALRELTLVVGVAPGFVIPDGPQQTVTPRPDGRFDVVAHSGPAAPATAAERAAALRPTAELDADAPAIVALTAQITAGATTDRDKADRLVDWVYTNLDKSLSTNLSTASQVLARKVGDCTEHSLLLVALARAAGLPAREASGLMYMGDEVQRFGWHAWAQVVLDGRWVAIDGAWGEHVADAAHLLLAVDGDAGWVATMGAITISAP